MILELLGYSIPGVVSGLILGLSTKFNPGKKKIKEGTLPTDVFRYSFEIKNNDLHFNCKACGLDQYYLFKDARPICECLDNATSEKHYHIICGACEYKCIMLTKLTK
jgi:hypothetical protein